MNLPAEIEKPEGAVDEGLFLDQAGEGLDELENDLFLPKKGTVVDEAELNGGVAAEETDGEPEE